MKKKEMEELRLKLNQELDDKKLKITQLNIEKHENHLRVFINKMLIIKNKHFLIDLIFIIFLDLEIQI